MRKIRLFFFAIFAIIALIPFIIGCLFLDKKQTNKILEMLWDWVDSVEEEDIEPHTIEDSIFINDANLTQEDYSRGTNKNLSVECRICGENTKRGRFYKKKYPKDNNDPYLFICRECYHMLPPDKQALTEQQIDDLFQEKVLG